MSTQPIKVSLPNGHDINVEEIVGPESFKGFLEKFTRKPSVAPRQNRLFLFFAPKQNIRMQDLTAYALYENGSHVAFYKIEQTKAGIIVSHCAPTNERTITPEIRALLESLQPTEILDVGRQKGLYFNQDQNLVRREPGETEVVFKERLIAEALRQIEQLHKQQRPGVSIG
jgi:hypothetical protein